MPFHSSIRNFEHTGIRQAEDRGASGLQNTSALKDGRKLEKEAENGQIAMSYYFPGLKGK